MEEVDEFLKQSKKWKDEMTRLREICIDCGLTEDYKWKHPCYTFRGKNVVLIHGFKTYCALLFHKGALLKDDNNILIQQTENVQAARQIRFTNLDDINDQEAVIKAYIFEAIELEIAGVEMKLKKTSQFEIAAEFKEALAADSDLEVAFNALSPGRQRGYLLYFSQAKLSKTRENRVKKSIPNIFRGKGLNDK